MKRLMLVVLLSLLAVSAFAAPTTPADRSLLVVATYIGGADFFELPLIQVLLKQGWHVQRADITEVKEPLLKQFQVVVITDATRLDPAAAQLDAMAGTRPMIEGLSRTLSSYVEEGGNLWIFARSSNHMGSPDALNAMNVILEPWDAQVAHEMIRDPQHESNQLRYWRYRYFYTNAITKDPLTEGVTGIWSPNQIMVGITSPLTVGKEWTPLIRGMKGSGSDQVVSDNGYPFDNGKPGQQKEGVIAAVRTLGQGRILLTGWCPTIPAFGFNHVVWDDLMPSAGLAGKKSDWLTFFTRSLAVLADGAKNVGGYAGAPVVRTEPPPSIIRDWDAVKPGVPNQPLFKGIIGASTSLSDGTGTVADYVKVAQEMGLNWVVFTEDLQKITEDGFKQLVAQCQAASSEDFAAIPGLKYLEVNNNHKIIVGPTCWPKASKLHLPDKTIYDPVFLWFESGVPLHLYYDMKDNAYPAYTYRGYNAMAVVSFDEGKQIEDATAAYLDNNHHCDLLTPVAVNLMRSPAALRTCSFYYYAPANKLADWVKDVGREYPRYGGWGQGFISSGPRIRQWEAVNGHRFTAGRWYVPGTERWRVALRCEADVPLQTVEILENQQVIRTYRPTGTSFEVYLDELHDRQKVLVARVTDQNGNWALTGGITLDDGLYRQFLCSDRQNYMSGQQDTRTADDKYVTIGATGMIDKDTRAGFGNVQTSDSRALNPYGVDGGYGNTFSMGNPVQVRGKTWDCYPYAVYHQGFRYCSRDAIIFDEQYTHRAAPDSPAWPSLENPWQALDPQRYFQATVTGYYFPHQFGGISPTLVDYDLSFDRQLDLSRVCNPNMGKWIFWTHRLGFHHPEFHWKTDRVPLKGFVGWDTPPTNVYSDNFPALNLATHEGEVDTGVEDVCSLVSPDGQTTTLKAGPDAAHPAVWQGTMQPGQFLSLYPNPAGAGGFFLLNGDFQARIELGYDWKRIYTGLYDLRSFAPGDQYNARLLLFQSKLRDTDPVKSWTAFRDAWGVAGKAPAYGPKLTRGKVLDTRYLLRLQAQDGAVVATLGQADLGQRLPLEINGLSDHCTAGIVNNTRKEWLPVGVVNGQAYATLDTQPGSSDVYVGNLVACSQPDLWVTVLPVGEGFVVDVHNPTAQAVSATVTAPEGLWMIKAGTKAVDVPAGTTVRVVW
ncbi:MAG TPA: hypothetical protein VGM19_01025 [Armatimonadota bacterium]|jgi:hypothetical protein